MTTAATEPAVRHKSWMPEIERLKGLAIILVAWGHVYHASLPETALLLRTFIYSFHMPVFMFMSGYVLAHSANPLRRMSFSAYAGKRFNRLILPFFAMAAIVIAGKFAAQHFVEVRGPVTDLFDAVSTVFVRTDDSPVVFIWYLAVVFAFALFTIYAVYIRNMSLRTLYLISLGFYAFHLLTFHYRIRTDYLYFNKMMLFYPSFVLGMIVYSHRDSWLSKVDRWWPVAAVLVGISAYFLISNEWRYLIVGGIACFAFLGLSRSPILPFKRAFAFLGKHSFAIYLLNMPFIGLTLGVLGRVSDIGTLGYAAIVLATLCGLVGPIMVKLALQSFSLSRPVAQAME